MAFHVKGGPLRAEHPRGAQPVPTKIEHVTTRRADKSSRSANLAPTNRKSSAIWELFYSDQ